MRQILLVSEERVKTVSNLDNNVFGKWLMPAIREAQDIGLQSIIGSCLYNQLLSLVASGDIAKYEYENYKDLLDYQIQDYLIYKSLVNVVPLINVHMANAGTVVSNDEHIQTLSQGNIDLVRNYYQSLADVYQKRLQDYLKCHCDLFPELGECGCGSCAIKPNLNSNTNATGLWLGGLRNRKGKLTDGCCGGSSTSNDYQRGYNDGRLYQKSLLTSTAFTENEEYYTENGWNNVIVNVPQTGYTQDDLDNAYQSGKTDQKNLLVSTAFTQNGTYSKEDGYSSVSINVPQTGHTDEELEQAYQSGMTDQKAKLSAITITSNGTYSREDGYSGITVSVESGQTINNQDKSFIITNNTAFTITYDSGYTGLGNVGLTVEIPQTGHTDAELEQAYQSGKTDQKNLLVSTAFTQNGTYSREDGYSSVSINVPQTQIAYHRLVIDLSYSDRVSGLTNNAVITVTNNSGSTNYTYTGSNIEVSLLPGVDYTISYSRVDNYTKPNDETITTKWGFTTTIYPIYTYNESGDFSKDYLTFEIVSGGTLVFSTNATSYIGTTPISININNSGWEDYNNFDASLVVNVGDIVKVRGNNTQYGTIYNHYGYYSTVSGSTCYYNVYGNIMSLCYGGNFSGETSFPSGSTNTFYGLFAYSNVLDASNLILPATTLAEGCYRHLFFDSIHLRKVPKELPATTLAEACYESMFEGCYRLLSVPSNYLPVTYLEDDCYAHMFFACTGLTSVPYLPAMTLKEDCYEGMFGNCYNINYIKCLATDISANGTSYWVSGVAPVGTFVKATSMTGWTIDNNDGIPSGWTIVNGEDTKYLEVPDKRIFGYTGSTKEVAVVSNTDWTVETSDNWITVSTVSGSGNNSFLITVSPSSNERTGTVTVKTIDSSIIRNITIEQEVWIYNELPLTTEILSDGYIQFNPNDINRTFNKSWSYRINGGDWIEYTNEPIRIHVVSGDVLQFIGNNIPRGNYEADSPGFYGTTCEFNIFGNIMSLQVKTDFANQTDLSDGKLIAFFKGCTGLIDASNLILPATTLASECYKGMFQECTALTTAPTLPATTLVSQCYYKMFQWCTSLTTAPALPATTLASECYKYMFYYCTALTTAPTLSATTLATSCYDSMFRDCTSLTTAPELPATTLVNYCYGDMFNGCTSLNYIKCLATDISAISCTTNWVNGVSATGTFVRPSGVSWTSGVNGVPVDWTVISDNS